MPDFRAVRPLHSDAADRGRASVLCDRGGRIAFGTLLFLSLVAGAIYLTLHYAPPWMAYRAMLEVLQEEVGAAGVSSDDELSDRILATAREWDVPITKDQIEIKRTDNQTTISTHWDATVTLFGGRFRQVLHFAPSTKALTVPASR